MCMRFSPHSGSCSGLSCKLEVRHRGTALPDGLAAPLHQRHPCCACVDQHAIPRERGAHWGHGRPCHAFSRHCHALGPHSALVGTGRMQQNRMQQNAELRLRLLPGQTQGRRGGRSDTVLVDNIHIYACICLLASSHSACASSMQGLNRRASVAHLRLQPPAQRGSCRCASTAW